MSAVASDSMPRWDMAVVYPSLDSPEYAEAFRSLSGGIQRLKEAFDRYEIEEGRIYPGDCVQAYEKAVEALNDLLKQFRVVGSYTSCTLAADTRDATAQAKTSELNVQYAELRKLQNRFTGWLGTLDIDDLLARSNVARDLEYSLRKAQIQARHLMSASEESLAADLGLTGHVAWSNLHSDMTSQLEVEVDGRKMPMSAVRNLSSDPDREVRRRAYEAELAAWRTVEVPLAAAMNAIKGEIGTLCRRRGWSSPLEEALFHANIDRQTLDSMMLAAEESFPMFRRYLKAKAKALGLERLAWYDLFAPVGGSTRSWGVEDAQSFVAANFGNYSDKMRAFAERSFRERWIDWEPRAGKVGGAFCSGIREDESRILMNYEPTFAWVSTLAHELGHGYHNLCLADRSPLQRDTPMTLAETASIFCETIVKRAALQEGSAEERLSILEGSVQGFCQVVVDITSRYLYETSVFDGRESRNLSAAEMCAAMEDAQRKTYGDGLEDGALHPYMWAVKPHYYDRYSYYNFPYMFGLLFGLGLYARYESDPDGFRSSYDDLLSSTGLASADALASRFGIDIRTPGFWRDSLAVIQKDIEAFEQAVGA